MRNEVYMNKTKLAALAAAVLLLTGCTNNNPGSSDNSTNNSTESSVQSDVNSSDNSSNSDSTDSSAQSGTESSEQSSTESSENSQPDAPSEPPTLEITAKEQDEPKGARTKITGLDKHSIFTSQITSYTDKDGQQGTYSDEKMALAICDGFAYISNPSDICYTSKDNADIFNEEMLSFDGIATSPKLQEYVRINVGDKVNGLTVSSAKTMFIDDDMGLPETALGKYFRGCECTFSGEMELNGYICIVPENTYGVLSGDILFVPSGSCRLPVMSFMKDSEVGTYHTYFTGSEYGMTYVNQYAQIFLGNINSTKADLSQFTQTGEFTKAKLVVKNIRMSSSVDWNTITEAEIITIEKV